MQVQSTFRRDLNRRRLHAVNRWLAGAGAALLAATTAQAQTPQLRTSDEAGRANLRGALMAPLRDMNFVRDDVPQVLTGAQEAPYLNPLNASCADLAALITPLEAALGPDRGDGAVRAPSGGRSFVLGALADATRDVIPFRGVVRRVTGASRHDQKVREAREAGQLRRAYLKGYASANGCYGPPQQVAVTAPMAAVQLAEAPPIAPPIVPVALAPPAPAAVQAQPAGPIVRFNLPEAWQVQVKDGGDD